MIRWFFLSIVLFLVVVVLAVDRVGAIEGAHVLAGRLQTDENLQSRPDVSIGGFPFLTQALHGNYKDVSVTAHEVRINKLTVTTITVHLLDAQLPFGRTFDGSVKRVPVKRINGTAFLSFVDANGYLATNANIGTRITLSAGKANSVIVSERARIGGIAVSLHGVGKLELSKTALTVAVSKLSLDKGSAGTNSVLARVPEALRSISLPLQNLPFHMKLTSVDVSSTGMTATGFANNVVLGGKSTS